MLGALLLVRVMPAISNSGVLVSWWGMSEREKNNAVETTRGCCSMVKMKNKTLLGLFTNLELESSDIVHP